MLLDRRMAIGCGGAGQSGICSDDPARLRRWRRAGGAVLRAGELVSRRRGADAFHRVALRRTEPGAADVSPKRDARRFDSRFEVVRSLTTATAGRLVAGAAPSSRE